MFIEYKMGVFSSAAYIDCDHSFKHAFHLCLDTGKNDINHIAIRAKVVLNTSNLK